MIRNRFQFLPSGLFEMLLIAGTAGFGLFEVPSAANGQTQPPGFETYPPRGISPTGSYDASSLGTVNTTNGILTYQVPLASLPSGPGGVTGSGVSLVYNSAIYKLAYGVVVPYPQTSINPTIPGVQIYPDSTSGWQYAFQYGLYADPKLFTTCSISNSYNVKLRFRFPDGSMHPLRLRDHMDDGYGYHDVGPGGNPGACSTSGGVSGTMTYYTTDGTFVRVDVFSGSADPDWTKRFWAATFPDGRLIQGQSSQTLYISERNGSTTSVLNYFSGGEPVTELRDQQLRSVKITYHGTSSGISQSSSSDTISTIGFGGTPLANTVYWRASNVPESAYRCDDGNPGPICPFVAANRVVSAISIADPSGRYYFFGYDENLANHYGGLNAITTPSGAHAAFEYKYAYPAGYLESVSVDYIAQNPTAKKTVSYQDVQDLVQTQAVPEITTYVYSDSASGGSTAVTAPDNGQTTYSFYSRLGTDNAPAWKRGLVYQITRKPQGGSAASTLTRVLVLRIIVGMSQV